MKKIVLVLSMVLIVLMGNVTTGLADAMSYDMEEAGYYVYVATPDGGLNMRYGPGTEYDRVTVNRIPDGVRLYIGYVSGNWGYTSYNGNEGWVALRQTTTTPPAPPATPKPTAVPAPVVTQSPQNTDSALSAVTEQPQSTDAASATEVPEEAQEISRDAQIVKTAMFTQIVLVAALVFLVVVIAVLVVIIINLKSRR